MSLKAKIEAVIYASEEPVTLAQLIGLLGQEAQAELDRAEAAQGSLSLNETELDLEDAGEEDTSPSETSGGTASYAANGDKGEGATSATSGDGEAETASSSAVAAVDGVELPSGELASGETGSPAEAAGEVHESGEAESAPPDPAAVARSERARAARLRTYFRSLLDSLLSEYAVSDRGLEIREVAGGFRFATKPEYHDAVRGFVRSLKPPLKLSLQALETLAVVAYKQPVTAPEISEIRGVDSGGVLASLMARKLITTAGRKQVIGRPILYKTTKEFLLKFGLKDIGELPSIEEFERMAGQMVEQEEIRMPESEGSRESDGAGEERDPNAHVHSGDNSETEDAEVRAGNESAERDAYAPYEDGPSAPADDLAEAPEDKASVDGRISSLPPDYSADDEDDPSAREAEIQSEQG